MKKTLQLILAVLIAGVGFSVIEARLTGTDPGTDAFCVGANGAEACVDASGNIIPTTDSDADVGTSALRWANGYFDTMDVGTTLTMPASSVTTAKIATNAVTTSKLYLDLPSSFVACVTTAKILGYCSSMTAATGVCNNCN